MNHYVECNDGWKDLYGPVLAAADELNVGVRQVKEKFGELRIYLDGGPDWLREMAYRMGDLSNHVCEVCGKDGRKINDNGWIKVRCEECT